MMFGIPFSSDSRTAASSSDFCVILRSYCLALRDWNDESPIALPREIDSRGGSSGGFIEDYYPVSPRLSLIELSPTPLSTLV